MGYPTFCKLAGVDGTDDPPVPPLAPSDAPATCSDTITNTIKQCGSGYNFLDASGPAECCAACQADDKCTHWVFDKSQSKPPCHLKNGDSSCSSASAGASSGIKGGHADIYQGNKSFPP